MSDREILDKYFNLEEGILESIHSENLTDIVLKIKISEWNLTKSFFSEWSMPTEHVEARNALERIMPGSFLKIVCRNIALFEIDRVKRHGRPELLLVRKQSPQTADAEDGSKIIFGFGFKDESLLKENLLKKHSERFMHMVIDTVGVRINLIFEELKITNFPDRLTS